MFKKTAFVAPLVLLVAILTACGSNPTPVVLPTALPNALPNGAPPAGIQVVLGQSVITVGENRFAIGLTENGTTLKNANLTLAFFDLSTTSTKPASRQLATYREAPDGLVGIYTTQINFPHAGSWGLAVTGETAEGKPINQQIGFDVAQSSTELAVGQKAPLAKSPTLKDVGDDLKKLTSASTPQSDFYRLSLDQALQNGLPTVVQFQTPAFCNSTLCGPVYDVLRAVYPAFQQKANFVHVEVYKGLPTVDPTKGLIADSMIAWGLLKSEPWTYVVDKNDVVVWRAEGLISADELTTQLKSLVGN